MNEAPRSKAPRGIFAKFSESLPPSFAKATEGSPRLHPRGIRQRTDQPWLKLRGIRRRRINPEGGAESLRNFGNPTQKRPTPKAVCKTAPKVGRWAER
jgi:hypothetical protein